MRRGIGFLSNATKELALMMGATTELFAFDGHGLSMVHAKILSLLIVFVLLAYNGILNVSKNGTLSFYFKQNQLCGKICFQFSHFVGSDTCYEVQNNGRYRGADHQVWHPYGCMVHKYSTG